LAYGPQELCDIERYVELVAPRQTVDSIRKNPGILRNVQVILTGWGAPHLDETFLEAAPNLRAVFYAAGSLSGVLSDVVWKRGIVVTSAIAANAIPVAEYSLATILFSLKFGFRFLHQLRQRRGFNVHDRNLALGCYQKNIGLISLGTIGRKLLELLKSFDLNVLVYDPFVSVDDALARGVQLVPLDELFQRSDVVSLHTPQLIETEGMIRGRHFWLMKTGATFINTARAAIVRQDELIEVAVARPDLQFVLDVTEPEPLDHDSPLYSLPNVVLTPHIAGSVGNECRRMGRCMVEELERFANDQPLRWSVTRESVRFTSHRPVSAAPALAPRISVTLGAALAPSQKV
jgi:phosphoglycerate dehydrogenase-like enzyme